MCIYLLHINSALVRPPWSRELAPATAPRGSWHSERDKLYSIMNATYIYTHIYL